MDLNGKVVVITGGAQGLGRAMALRLAPKKPHIALIDMNEDSLAEAKALIERAGAKVSTWVCNVAKEEEVDVVFAQIAAQTGRLDAVVNNAGITRDSMLLKVKDGVVENRMSVEHWQQVLDVNLTGTFLCGRAAATEMVKAGNGGCIINISSISRAGNMGQSNYSAAKAGVAAMTVTWAKELARQNIRVAAIAPGFIETEMTKSMKPEALAKMAAGIPLKRMGKPDEIAHSAAFIFENDYYTGRIIECDGGLRL